LLSSFCLSSATVDEYSSRSYITCKCKPIYSHSTQQQTDESWRLNLPPDARAGPSSGPALASFVAHKSRLPQQQCDRSLHHALGCRRACPHPFDAEKKAPSPSTERRESLCAYVCLCVCVFERETQGGRQAKE
jgi:hypothetical protein